MPSNSSVASAVPAIRRLATCGLVDLVILSAVALAADPSPFAISEVRVETQRVTITWPAQIGRFYRVDRSTSLTSWEVLAESHPVGGATEDTMSFTDTSPNSGAAFYRVAALPPPAPEGFLLIPGGPFEMGDDYQNPAMNRRPHDVALTPFYMQLNETTKAEWDEVRAWAGANGYTFDNYGPTGELFFSTGAGKAPDHPVGAVTWYDAVKWCNARSQKEGLNPCYFTDETRTIVFARGQTSFTNEMVDWAADGYRLPTEAEWERAARGGLEGRLFPWGDTITHSQANYYSSTEREYDISPTRGYHPDYWTGSSPFTSPVGSFPANSYGLFDMAGNVFEWCWDVYETDYYLSSPSDDPRGPFSGRFRVDRGGSYDSITAAWCRVAVRSWADPFTRMSDRGFRTAKSR